MADKVLTDRNAWRIADPSNCDIPGTHSDNFIVFFFLLKKYNVFISTIISYLLSLEHSICILVCALEISCF